jgi:hypothetical protein
MKNPQCWLLLARGECNHQLISLSASHAVLQMVANGKQADLLDQVYDSYQKYAAERDFVLIYVSKKRGYWGVSEGSPRRREHLS